MIMNPLEILYSTFDRKQNIITKYLISLISNQVHRHLTVMSWSGGQSDYNEARQVALGLIWNIYDHSCVNLVYH